MYLILGEPERLKLLEAREAVGQEAELVVAEVENAQAR